MRDWLTWKLHWLKCEIIYFFGGVPKAHINTVNYRNISKVIANLQKTIKNSKEKAGEK